MNRETKRALDVWADAVLEADIGIHDDQSGILFAATVNGRQNTIFRRARRCWYRTRYIATYPTWLARHIRRKP